ncbi:unnamed protein product [Ceutorhynchus assimilis]|uniref:ENTH domain-containing protein n=1 Tax=Ceutorhynchus assimilis TaxID=467358 RepID=A0A9N9MNA9_9CUCU|nr:unnamed protein product [Ceutorhynchus assimilis]
MESLFSMWKVREIADKVTNVVMNYTEIEAKVRQATNDEAWGPTGTLMQELAHATFTHELFPELMSMLWKRMLNDNKQHWRRTYKALLVLNYLIKNGSERVVRSSKKHLCDLRSLENFTAMDDNGKDQGLNIRHKVKELIDFIQDNDRLLEERKKAKRNKNKYVGMSSDSDMAGIDFGSTSKKMDDKQFSKNNSAETNWDKNFNKKNKSIEEDVGYVNSSNDNLPRVITNSSHTDKDDEKVNLTFNASPNTIQKPLIEIDSADCVRDSIQNPLPKLPDDLFEDFNPRAGEILEIVDNELSSKGADDFGNFNSALLGTKLSQSNLLISSSTSQNISSTSGNLIGEFSRPPAIMPFIENSGNDLLGDFSNLNLQHAEHAKNNNILNQEGLLDNFDDGQTTKKVTLQKSLEEFTVTAIDKLKKIGKITSQEDIDKILQYLDDLLKNYPQILNIQKLQGSEEVSYKHLAENSFSTLIEVIVVDLFDSNFPFRDGKIYKSIRNIFSIEDSDFFEAILEVLVKNIRNKKNTQGANVAGCLQVLFESDALFAYIVANCYLITESNDIIFDNWSGMVNIIISLPTRVANKLERNAPIFLSNKQFSNLLFYNFLKVIEFLASEVYADSKAQNNIHFDKLAIFLSNIIIHFNEKTNCDGIIDFVNILALITNKPSQKLYLYQGILQEVFQILNTTAIDILAKICLTRINPKQYLITNLLSKKLIENPNWQYILCTKLSFTEFIEANHENFVTNLILYLGKASHTELVKFLMNLVSVWANKSSIKRTGVEHQLLICKFIVCAVNCLKEIGLTDYEKSKIEKNVHRGIQMHLEIAIEPIRYLGMKIGEILTKLLENQSLEFNYEKTSADTKVIIAQLDYFMNLDLVQLYKQKCDFDDIETFIVKLHNKSEKQYIAPERKFRIKHQHNEIVISEYVKPKNDIIIIDNTFELDSDDEFEPYDTDTDNEVKILSKQPPAYLRDVITILVEDSDDVDAFTLCLENCEKLIIQQLPENDVEIGLEILTILIALNMKFYMENFDKLIFESCVAITCVYPAVYADYLCKEIHAEAGKYSLRQKILMLDILRQGSITLSSLTKPVNEIKKTNKKDVNSHQEIIKKRLESKTRYFHKHKIVKYEQRNKFADVAGYFFFPLMYNHNQHKLSSENDLILSIHFIETLAIIIQSAENCPIALKMAKEALYFSRFLRYHKDIEVRIAILHLIVAAVLAVPQSILVNDFMNELFELQLWLADLTKGEPNTECRNLALCTLGFIEKLLIVDLESLK